MDRQPTFTLFEPGQPSEAEHTFNLALLQLQEREGSDRATREDDGFDRLLNSWQAYEIGLARLYN